MQERRNLEKEIMKKSQFETLIREVIRETIRKVDGKYVVYPEKGGKRLGTHSTKAGAEKQLTAIHLNKEEEKLPKGKTPVDWEKRDWELYDENYADGKVKGKSRPGRVKRAGASCKGSVTDLRAKAKKYGGEKGKMYHWCANMKAGKK
jgi:hypothetical protein